MLVVNKMAVSRMPMPGFVSFVQLLFATVVLMAARALAILDIDGYSSTLALSFAPYIGAFTAGVFTNMKALEYSNVETVIVFRACSPLIVSVLEWLYLGRDLPGIRSLSALLGVAIGAMGYMMADSEFQMQGFSAYGWVSLYLASIVVSMTEGKRLLSQVKFDSPIWGSVLYTNAMSLFPMAALALSTGEMQVLGTLQATPSMGFWLAVSCVIGIGISWSGWDCRDKLSATGYTLVGVTCKFLTVLINAFVAERHPTDAGVVCLLVCLACSSLYQQAPIRRVPSSPTKGANHMELGEVSGPRVLIGAPDAEGEQ